MSKLINRRVEKNEIGGVVLPFGYRFIGREEIVCLGDYLTWGCCAGWVELTNDEYMLSQTRLREWQIDGHTNVYAIRYLSLEEDQPSEKKQVLPSGRIARAFGL